MRGFVSSMGASLEMVPLPGWHLHRFKCFTGGCGGRSGRGGVSMYAFSYIRASARSTSLLQPSWLSSHSCVASALLIRPVTALLEQRVRWRTRARTGGITTFLDITIPT